MRLRLALVIAATLVLLGAACSDDSEDAATEDTTTSAPDTTDDTTEDATDAPEDDDEAEAPEDDDEAETPEASGEGFCGLLASDADVDPLTEEGQAMMAEILATAPDELQEPIETLFGIFEQLGDIDEDDAEAMGEVFALMMDPEVIAASEEIEAWGVENCGLEPGFFSGEGTDSALQGDGAGSSDEEDEVSFKVWAEENYTDAAWVEAASVWGRINDTISVGGDFDAELALEACEAAVEYMTEFDSVDSITISDPDGEPIVEGADGECAAA